MWGIASGPPIGVIGGLRSGSVTASRFFLRFFCKPCEASTLGMAIISAPVNQLLPKPPPPLPPPRPPPPTPAPSHQGSPVTRLVREFFFFVGSDWTPGPFEKRKGPPWSAKFGTPPSSSRTTVAGVLPAHRPPVLHPPSIWHLCICGPPRKSRLTTGHQPNRTDRVRRTGKTG